tara:strand:- start:264 stop:464 length:201 start_codon:yes stop_codon:yes gene_type:complete
MSLVIRFAKCKKYLNELNMSHGTFWEDAKLTFDITLMKKVINILMLFFISPKNFFLVKKRHNYYYL